MAVTIAVGTILYKGGSVLLVRHTEKAKLPTDAYGFPAGRYNPEKDESLKDAAVRELREESGFETSVKFLEEVSVRKSSLNMKQGKEEFEFHAFCCSKYWGELKNNEDATIPEWVELSRLDEIPVISEDVRMLSREYFNN